MRERRAPQGSKRGCSAKQQRKGGRHRENPTRHTHKTKANVQNKGSHSKQRLTYKTNAHQSIKPLCQAYTCTAVQTSQAVCLGPFHSARLCPFLVPHKMGVQRQPHVLHSQQPGLLWSTLLCPFPPPHKSHMQQQSHTCTPWPALAAAAVTHMHSLASLGSSSSHTHALLGQPWQQLQACGCRKKQYPTSAKAHGSKRSRQQELTAANTLPQ